MQDITQVMLVGQRVIFGVVVVGVVAIVAWFVMLRRSAMKGK